MMDLLWAPWRMQYLKVLGKKSKGCQFCKIYRQKNDSKNYVFKRSKHCFAVLNIYPYNNGHILIVSNRHVSSLSKLRPEEREDLFALLDSSTRLLDKVLRPQGYNIGINIGRVSGAGFPGHVHLHVVPRWMGDMNFMPIVSGTKVISQSLRVLFKSLSKNKPVKQRNSDKRRSDAQP